MFLETILHVRFRRLCLMACVVCGSLSAGGCGNPFYDWREVRAFLKTPRKDVSALEYRVYPPDTISITSLHVPEINGRRQRLRPDGKVNLPLIGEVYIAGMTPSEIEKALVKASGKYYEQADATVEIASYASQNYFVFGQVSRSGPVPWTGRDTVLDALARARPTNLAWPERIVLIRAPDPMGTGFAKKSTRYLWTGCHSMSGDQVPKKLKINLLAMIESGDLANNVLLMPNDIIYVQPSPLAKIGLTLQKLLFPITQAIQTTGTPGRFATAGTIP